MTIRTCLAFATALLLPAAAGAQYETETPDAPTATLTLTPGAAPAGAAIEARGAGFAGRCAVLLQFDGPHGTTIGRAEVDKAGAFVALALVPAEVAVGSHVVTAVGLDRLGERCAQPSDVRAEAELEVLPAAPTLMIDTAEPRPGTSIEITGSGFCGEAGCSSVTIQIDGLIMVEQVDVAADGTWSAQAQVPAVDAAAGETAVVARQTDAGGREIRAFGEIFVSVKPNIRNVPQ